MAKKRDIDLELLGRVITEEVTQTSELEYKAFAFDVFGEVLRKTPVDTGRARANWHIETKAPNYSLEDTTTPKIPADLVVTDYPLIYISNGLEYVEALEDGRSKQAPNGITQPALAAVRSRR